MISFVIPTLNEEKIIEKTLKNISEYKGVHEIIISDGGSTDNTINIAKIYTNKIIEHKGPKKQTIAEGRNEGAFLAIGSFIVEMDADTRFPNINNFFEKIINTFEKNEEIVGMTTWFRVYPENEKTLDRIIFGITGFVSLILNNYFKLGCASGGEFQMIKTEAFLKIGGYNKNLIAMEDVEMFSRLRNIGKIYFEKNLFIYHSGRRAHILGWHIMIYTFFVNSISLLFFKKVASKTWKVVR